MKSLHWSFLADKNVEFYRIFSKNSKEVDNDLSVSRDAHSDDSCFSIRRIVKKRRFPLKEQSFSSTYLNDDTLEVTEIFRSTLGKGFVGVGVGRE